MMNEHLYILWTNADVTTAKLMVMMYAKNSLKNQWWNKVTVIVWGATTKLLSESEELQQEMKEAVAYGVDFSGCIACAQELDVVEELTDLGVDLYKWGPKLTEIIKEKLPLITV